MHELYSFIWKARLHNFNGLISQMRAITPIIHCIVMLISWQHKNLGIYYLGVAQAPRPVMKSEFLECALNMERGRVPT